MTLKVPKTMKHGFTLVELMVTVTIMMLMVGGGAIYLGNFNTRQKLRGAKAELLSSVRQARDIAKVSQQPSDFSNPSQAHCVQLNVNDLQTGKMTVETDGGDTYFSKQLSDASVSVGLDSTMPCFAFFSTRLLVSDVNGTMFPYTVGASSAFILTTAESVGDSEMVVVDASGVINE